MQPTSPPSPTRLGLPHLGLVGTLLFLLGGYWDVAWHIEIGRDTFWSPPHLLLYAGILLVLATLGLGLLGAVLRRGQPDAESGPTIALPFGLRVSPGLVIAGLGAVMSLTSAPIDNAWHAVFGLDVTIWSPPHLQLIFGVALAAFGLIAVLAGELNRSDSRRLTDSLPPLDADSRVLGIVCGTALLLSILGATLGEYQFAVPQYALAFYPPILGAIVGGVLLFGARAAGRRWAATAICVVYVGIQLLGWLELELVGLGRQPSFVLVPLAGLVVDLVWPRLGQSVRPLPAAAVGGLAALAGLATQAPYLEALSPLPWSSLIWPTLAPAAVLAGAAAGVVGARAGYALRPTPREATRRARLAARLGLPLLALALALVVAGTALAYEVTPQVKIVLGSSDVVAGQPTTVKVEVTPADSLQGSQPVIALFEQADERVVPSIAPAGAAGIYEMTATLPRPGQWSFAVVADADEGRLVAWTTIRVASAPGAGPANPLERTLDLKPNIVRSAAEERDDLLLLGKAAVWGFTAVMLLLAALCLRVVERDALASTRSG